MATGVQECSCWHDKEQEAAVVHVDLLVQC